MKYCRSYFREKCTGFGAVTKQENVPVNLGLLPSKRGWAPGRQLAGAGLIDELQEGPFGPILGGGDRWSWEVGGDRGPIS